MVMILHGLIVWLSKFVVLKSSLLDFSLFLDSSKTESDKLRKSGWLQNHFLICPSIYPSYISVCLFCLMCDCSKSFVSKNGRKLDTMLFGVIMFK